MSALKVVLLMSEKKMQNIAQRLSDKCLQRQKQEKNAAEAELVLRKLQRLKESSFILSSLIYSSTSPAPEHKKDSLGSKSAQPVCCPLPSHSLSVPPYFSSLTLFEVEQVTHLVARQWHCTTTPRIQNAGQEVQKRSPCVDKMRMH